MEMEESKCMFARKESFTGCVSFGNEKAAGSIEAVLSI